MCFDLRGTAWQHDMLSSVVQQDKRLNNYLDECYILHSNFGGSAASVNQQARFLAFIRVKPDVTSPAGAVVAGKRRMIGSRAFHYNLKASWNGIYIYSLAITQINVINWITTKFCTCHYSTAVGACAKFSLWPRILSMNIVLIIITISVKLRQDELCVPYVLVQVTGFTALEWKRGRDGGCLFKEVNCSLAWRGRLNLALGMTFYVSNSNNNYVH